MIALFQKLWALLKQIGLGQLLQILNAIQMFLAGEEQHVFITLANGVKIEIIVDLQPLTLKIIIVQ